MLPTPHPIFQEEYSFIPLLHTPTTYYTLLTYYLLLTIDYLPLTTHCTQPITYTLLLTTHHWLHTTYYLLSTTYYLLLTTYYLRLTTHYLLLTASGGDSSICTPRGVRQSCAHHRRLVSTPPSRHYPTAAIPRMVEDGTSLRHDASPHSTALHPFATPPKQ